MDGLARLPTPTLLILADEPTAAAVAEEIHQGRASWPTGPSRVDGLLQVATARLLEAGPDDCQALLSEVSATDHWLFVPDIEPLTQAPECAFLDQLLPYVRDGRLASLILSADPSSSDAVRAGSPRLAGFAEVLVAQGASWESWTPVRTIAAPATQRDDVGWVVMVRLELATGIEVLPQPESATDGVLHLVERFHLVMDDRGLPAGALVTLSSGAFSASQEDAVFRTAEAAATRLVGRPLAGGESVAAVRALLYF